MDMWPTWSKVDRYRMELEAEYEDKPAEEAPAEKKPEVKEKGMELTRVELDFLDPDDCILESVVQNDVFAIVVDKGDCWCLVINNCNTGDVDTPFTRGHGAKDGEFHAVFLCPQGHHILLSLKNGDTFYFNTLDSEIVARRIDRLNSRLTAVGWDKDNKRLSSSGWLLAGDARGSVFLCRLEQRLGCTQIQAVCDVSRHIENPCITGIKFERFADRPNKLLVLVSTTTRLYEFHGGPTLQDVFPKPINMGTYKQFVKLHPGPMSARIGLRTLLRSSGTEGSLGWCSTAGIYHAKLHWPKAAADAPDGGTKCAAAAGADSCADACADDAAAGGGGGGGAAAASSVGYNANAELNAGISAVHGGSYFSITKESGGRDSSFTAGSAAARQSMLVGGVSSPTGTTLAATTSAVSAVSGKSAALASSKGDLNAAGGGGGGAGVAGSPRSRLTRLSIHYGQHKGADVEKVLGLVLGENTMTVLFEESLQVLAQPAGLRWRGVEEPFDRIKAEDLKDRCLHKRPLKKPVNLQVDPRTGNHYLTTSRGMYEISVPDVESTQAWRSFLLRAMRTDEPDRAQYYVAASRLLEKGSGAVNDQIKIKAADFFYSDCQYLRAAEIYAETNTSFENTMSKLIDCGQVGARLTYLTKRIEFIKKRAMYYGQEASQLACLTTWACKVFLDVMSDFSRPRDPEHVDRVKKEFHAFVKDNIEHIQTTVVYDIVSAYNLPDELLYFSALTKNYRAVVAHYMRDGNYVGVLDCLKKHCLNHTSMVGLWYKYASRLIQFVPVELVDTLTDDTAENTAGSVLDPIKLIPAMLQYNVRHNPPGVAENQAVRYLSWVVTEGQATEQAVHNLLLYCYASDQTKPEEDLVDFLLASADDYYFDDNYALRLCLEHGRSRAAAHLYAFMEMHQDAVQLALQLGDVALAKTLASQAPDDATKKKLWVRTARHVLKRDKGNARAGGGVSASLAMLKECPLLKLDDLMPLLGDDVLIADFQAEILHALGEYGYEIEDLKRQMHEMTDDSKLITDDIALLRQRRLYLLADAKCRLCQKPLFTEPFYAFVLCRDNFHQSCLRRHITSSDTVSDEDRQRILTLLGDVQRVERMVVEGSAEQAHANEAREAKKALDQMVANQCPICGDLKIAEATQPFVTASSAEAASWEI